MKKPRLSGTFSFCGFALVSRILFKQIFIWALDYSQAQALLR